MPSNFLKLFLLVPCLFFTCDTVSAATDDQNGETLLKLEKIQAETVIYEAQLARAKALRELESNGIPKPDVSSGQSSVVAGGIVNSTPIPMGNGLPVISEIYGSPNRLFARLILSDGSKSVVVKGQQIPGTKWTVSLISANEVKVMDGSDVKSLAFDGD